MCIRDSFKTVTIVTNSSMYWCFLGPATVTGYVKPSIGLGVEAYLNTGKIAVTLYGSVAINSKLRIRVHR